RSHVCHAGGERARRPQRQRAVLYPTRSRRRAHSLERCRGGKFGRRLNRLRSIADVEARRRSAVDVAARYGAHRYGHHATGGGAESRGRWQHRCRWTGIEVVVARVPLVVVIPTPRNRAALTRGGAPDEQQPFTRDRHHLETSIAIDVP